NRMSVELLARGAERLPLTPRHNGETCHNGENGTSNESHDGLDHGVLDALAHASLCNDSGLADGEIVGDPTEGALLQAAVRAGIDPDTVRFSSPRIGEVPFDSASKYMATFHPTDDGVLCLVKGAPDVILDRASSAVAENGITPLTEATRIDWETANTDLAQQGMRVLAVAFRQLPASVLDRDGHVIDPESHITDLTIELLLGIIDPPRPEARDAIALCQQAGIGVKMITGDHALTAKAIASNLGIAGRVVTGAELDAMSDDELAATIDQIGVCARVSPDHKVRVVQALKRHRHIVAMTGDGVNDAAALRHADIGVAMGITGTEVTKEAADMVLADDNFATIVGAVERGRAIFDNIVKFVRFQLTTNLGAIGTLLSASLLGLPAPLSAIQVLFVNIIADGPPAMSLGLDPPDPQTMRQPPRIPGAPILDRARIIPLLVAAAVMTIGTLALLALARQQWDEQTALTMAFTTFVFFQLANVLNSRTEHASILTRQTLTNAKLWLAIGAVGSFQVLIVSAGPLQEVFDTISLSFS
ncbi:MAG: cation-transporting P-type ATPase, partial [Acidimicrobiales bacterium]|nr:cation-transporting P-type ATPase [Acidimicrobiales bacterium]